MTPDFTLLLGSGIVFSALVLAFLTWRFGAADVVVFAIVAGVFPAVMDFVSSFVVENYVYPGRSRVWVFTYIFFGWIAVCGTCMLLAEGILVAPGEDLRRSPRLIWQMPLVTAFIAVALDLFIDPIAVHVGYWVWRVPGDIYYGIPLLNFTGWFVLMVLAPLGWILIVRRTQWGAARRIIAGLVALLPLCVAAVVLSLVLNGILAGAGLH